MLVRHHAGVTGSLADSAVTVRGGTLRGSGTVGDVSAPWGAITGGDGGAGVLATGNVR